MKSPLGLTRRFVLFATPLFASSAVALAPAEAATLALSTGQATLFNFSRSPDAGTSFADTDTDTDALGGRVNATANANANLLAEPPIGTNETFSRVVGESVIGESTDYFGFADSQAEVIGSFLIPGSTGKQQFSFDFVGTLRLLTEIDDAHTESAQARGSIAFFLFDDTRPGERRLIDFFTVSGNLDTPGQDDELEARSSRNFTFAEKSLNRKFGGLQEAAIADIQGSYARTFELPTRLTLIEAKSNFATAEAVPEPSTMAAIAVSGVLGTIWKRRRNSHS
jgi:hypothetical protein